MSFLFHEIKPSSVCFSNINQTRRFNSSNSGQFQMLTADYLVLGGGIAGVSTAQTLHLLQSEATIVLVTATEVVKSVTELTHLTKLLSSFNVIETNITDWQRDNLGVQLVKGVVTNISRERKEVSVENYGPISYNKLCICTGGAPKIISAGNPHVLGIRDTQSVQHFQEKLKDATRVMVVGNGGIATEIVYEICNIEVIWAIKDSSISSVFVDAGAGEFLVEKINSNGPQTSLEEDNPVKRMKFTVNRSEGEGPSHLGSALGPDWHKGFSKTGKSEGKQVHVEYKVEIDHILSHSDLLSRNLSETAGIVTEGEKKIWNIYVELSNGKVYGCDFVVSATGVLPSGEMFKHVVELDAEGGIRIDEEMRTSAPDIYAAGDVCSAAWSQAPHWFQMRLWSQARQMGMMAAKAMVAHSTGETVELDFCFEMFAHVTQFFGYKLVLLGLYNGQKLEDQYEILLRVTRGREYVKAVMKEGRMQGALLIGQTDLEETFENLILNQLDLSQYGEDLLDPNIDIEDYFD